MLTICLLGVCMIIYFWGDFRQLHGYELDMPSIAPSVPLMTKRTTITQEKLSPDGFYSPTSTVVESKAVTFPPPPHTPHSPNFVVQHHSEGDIPEEDGYKMDVEAIGADRQPSTNASRGMLSPTTPGTHVLRFPNMPSMQSMNTVYTEGTDEKGDESGVVESKSAGGLALRRGVPPPIPVNNSSNMSVTSGPHAIQSPTTAVASTSIFDFDSLTLPPAIRHQRASKKQHSYSASLFSHSASSSRSSALSTTFLMKRKVRTVFAPVTKIVSPIVLRVIWGCLMRCSAWACLFAVLLGVIMFVIPSRKSHGHGFDGHW